MAREFAPFCPRLTHPTACLTSQPRQKGAAHSRCELLNVPASWACPGRTRVDGIESAKKGRGRFLPRPNAGRVQSPQT